METSDTLSFVLVHGSWHEGSCWRHVETRMRALGHETFAPTLRTAVGDRQSPATFQSIVDGLVRDVEAAGIESFVMVGHSAGGAFIRKAAEQLADRISRMVYLSPLLAESGESTVSAVPPDYGALFEQMAAASPDNTVLPTWPIWRDGFIGDAEEAVAKAAFDELRPEPFDPLTEPVDLSVFKTLQIPASYINPTEDVVFPIGAWGFFPRMYQKVAPCRLIQMSGGHEVMYSAPDALVDALIAAGRP